MCTAVRPAQGQDPRLIFLSKNDAVSSSEHVRYVREAFSHALAGKDALVSRMADEGITLCGEVIAPADETHGARVLCQSPRVVITCVSMHRTTSRFVSWLSPLDLTAFCETEGLPWSGAWPVTPDWFASVEPMRDRLTWSAFQAMAPPSAHRHAVDHGALLGDVLEGFVVHCYRDEQGGDFETFKYKLLRYVVRTMGLRSLLAEDVSFVTAVARLRSLTRRCGRR